MQAIEIANELIQNRIVAILRKVEKEKTERVLSALLDGGIKCIEITMDSDGTLETIRKAKKTFGDSLILGAGTVLDSVSCRMAIEAGAEYIVTPTVNIDVIKMANMYGKPCTPGAMTPTEILAAYEAGASMVKVFPASVLGPTYFREISGPLGHIPLMATGGISIDNIGSFVKAGVRAFGMGSSLISKKAVAEGDYRRITEDAAKIKSVIFE